jgi:hypothetical protein
MYVAVAFQLESAIRRTFSWQAKETARTPSLRYRRERKEVLESLGSVLSDCC